MTIRRLLALALAFCFVSGSAAVAAAPDEPWAPSVNYSSVTAGSKSYRPVQPLPWGDVNRRVAPVERTPEGGSSQQTPQRQDIAPQSTEPSHKQHR